MKEQLIEFLEWMPHNLEDIFEIVDKPEQVVDKYLNEIER